jgi:lysophospholipase L1-like esterase
MKKYLILLLLLPFLAISQAVPADASQFENIQMTNNATSTTAAKVVVQEANGVLNTIAKSGLIEVLEFSSALALPTTGTIGKIYVTLDNGKLYRWTGTFYNELSKTDLIDDSAFKVLKTTSKTVQETFSKSDEALFKARGTELSEGGIPSINVDPTKFNITPAVLGQIKDGLNYYTISYAGATGISVDNIAAINTYVYLDNAGALRQQTTAPSRTDFYTKLFLARFASNGTQLIGLDRLRNPSGQYSNSVRELYDYLVSSNVPLRQGLTITGNANLTFNRAAGSVFRFGAGTDATPNTPTFAAVNIAPFFLGTRSSLAGALSTNVPVTQYDNNGTLTTISNNQFVAHRVYFFTTPSLAIQYAQVQYPTLASAIQGAPTENYALNPAVLNGAFLGWWIVAKNATDLTNPATSIFLPFTLGGGGTGTVAGALLASNNLSDVANPITALINIGGEAAINKQDNLVVDGTGAKYPTVDAVNSGLSGKQPLENQRLSTTNDAVFNSLTASTSATINTLSVAGNALITAGEIVVRDNSSARYGRTSKENLQAIVGIGSDYVNTISLLLFQGDSMTAGVSPASPYPNSINVLNPFVKINNAVGSKTIATINLEAAALDDVLYRPYARENVYILWAGTNDLYNNFNVESAFNNLVATARNRQKKGFKVIVLTTLPRCGFASNGSTTMESLINAYNVLIRQRWSTFSDGIADVASNTTLQSVNPCTDTVYYNGDGIHLTNAGNALILPYIQEAINEVSRQITVQDLEVKGSLIEPISIKKAFGTSETALTINNSSNLAGNIGRIDFRARNLGFGDNVLTGAIEVVSNGASVGESVINFKVAPDATALNTILSLNGVSSTVTVNRLAITTTPATSTGSPPLLTYNVTTKDIESVPYNTLAKTYKVYTALLSQSGTAAPTAIVLENTLGGTILLARTSAGAYTLTLNGAFVLDKVAFFNSSSFGNVQLAIVRTDANTVSLGVYNGASQLDSFLNKTSIEIRVYN